MSQVPLTDGLSAFRIAGARHTLRFTIPVAKEGASKLVYRVRLRFEGVLQF